MAKPYDRLFKTLAEEDPRGLLYLFGSLSLDEPAEIEVVDRELVLPALAVDHVYRVRSGPRRWIAHYEAQTRYRADLPERIAWYAMALAMRFKIEVESTLVLLLERHAPLFVPDEHQTLLGSVDITVRYRVVKLWEVDPHAALRKGRPNLLPWITLMQSPEPVLPEAAAEIARTGDRRLAAEFVLLGGLRYDKNDLAAMLARGGTMFRLTQEMIEESSFYQMILEKGMEKGMEQGVERGRLEAARRFMRRILAARFPGLETSPEIDTVTNPDRLEALLDEVLSVRDPDAARAAISRAATS